MAGAWQTVRVFISSTFRDMHSERDWLIKRVFPALRERLERYRIYLVDIDLRWGVTEQQAESGGALDVCLDQIDACRPFFLGLLGERYGWVPQNLPQTVTSKYGWIQYTQKKSITELEILHGVLNDPQMHDYSFFCFRDPAFIDDVPMAIQPALRDDDERAEKLAALKAEIEKTQLPTPPLKYPCRYAGLKLNWRLAKLELDDADRLALEDVARDGLVDPSEYADLNPHLQELVHRFGTVQLEGLQEFGEQVGEWLWEAIRRRLDLPEQPPIAIQAAADPLAEEQDYHARFMESRLRVYVGREKINDDLLAFVEGNDPVPCLVTGPSGSGKSAALAQFVSKFSSKYRPGIEDESVLVIPHFIGASPRSTNLRDMLRRFCQILKTRFGFTDVPEEVAKLSVTFREFVGQVPADTRVLLVIDALNQLDEADRAQELYWLPAELPQQVKVIVSCITDVGAPASAGPSSAQPVLEAFRGRKHCSVQLAALSDAEQREIIRQVPSLSAKTLDDDQVRLLLSNPATANPLFLLVALEELRGFGSYERLNERIAGFPREGDAVTAIFTQVIERLAEEFNQQLVETVLTLLASARRGLSERELQELVAPLSPGGRGAGGEGGDGDDDLFPVLRQLRSYLLSRAGLIDFYHRNLFKAVRERYLAAEEQQRQAHGRLAEYFHAQDYWLESLDDQRGRAKTLPPTPRPANVRKVDELPWQLLQAADWQQSEQLLTDLAFLEAKVEAGMVFDLAADFSAAITSLPADRPLLRILRLLEEALRRDIHFIAGHSTTLFQCMWNTCWWYDCPDVDAHNEQAQNAFPFFRPSSILPPPPLAKMLESWRAQKKMSVPGFIWIRSFRPPPTTLGAGETAVLRGHENWVKGVVFSPDCWRIASVSGDPVFGGTKGNSLFVWDADSGRQILRIQGHDRELTCVAYSLDGRWLATSSTDMTVRLWDSVSGAQHRCFGDHYASSLIFTPDGKSIIGGSGGTVRVWDAETGVEHRCIGGHENTINSVAISPDGRRIVSASGHHYGRDENKDYTIRIWDATSGANLACMRGHQDCVMSVAYSPDGQWIVSGSWDRTVRVWDAETGNELSCIRGHSDNVWSVAFSPDGLCIASGSSDATVRIWDIKTGRELNCLRGHEKGVLSVAYSPDGRRIASGSYDMAVRVWNASGESALYPTSDHQGRVWNVVYSPKCEQIATAAEDKSVRVWDGRTGVTQQRLCGHEHWVLCAAFSPNGQRIVSGSWDKTARVWDIENGSVLHCLQGHESLVRCVLYSPDGRRIITCGDKVIAVWDAESGSLWRVLRGHEANAAIVAYSPDGRTIVSGASDETVRVWNAESAAELCCLRGHRDRVSTVACSSNGRLIVSGSDDKTVRVWDAENSTELCCLRGHDDWVRHVAFSADSRRIASESKDNTVRVWDAATFECLEVIPGRGDVAAIAAGARLFPWRARARGVETVIEDAASGKVIAIFPHAFEHIVTHWSSCQWAGSVGNHLYIITLEGHASPTS